MRDFRDNRSGRGRDFGKRNFHDRGSDRPMMHQTICSNCGKECEVPFKPTGSKPVYCRDCFRTLGESDSQRSDRRDYGRPQFDNRNNTSGGQNHDIYKEQFITLNEKLDKILNLLLPVTSLMKKQDEVKNAPVLDDQQPEKQIKEVVKKPKVSKKAPDAPIL